MSCASKPNLQHTQSAVDDAKKNENSMSLARRAINHNAFCMCTQMCLRTSKYVNQHAAARSLSTCPTPKAATLRKGKGGSVAGSEEVEEELGSEEEVGSSLESWCSSSGSVSGGEGEGEGTAWSAEVLPLLLLAECAAAILFHHGGMLRLQARLGRQILCVR